MAAITLPPTATIQKRLSTFQKKSGYDVEHIAYLLDMEPELIHSALTYKHVSPLIVRDIYNRFARVKLEMTATLDLISSFLSPQ